MTKLIVNISYEPLKNMNFAFMFTFHITVGIISYQQYFYYIIVLLKNLYRMPIALVVVSSNFRDKCFGSESLFFASCVTLGMSFISSEAQFPYKQNGVYIKTDNCWERQMRKCLKLLAWCLAWGKPWYILGIQ